MEHPFIIDQDQSKRTLRELQRLEQHKLKINLSLSKVNADTFFLKVSNKELKQNQVPQRTPTVFQIGDIVLITNHLCDEFGIFCEVIRVSDINHMVYLKKVQPINKIAHVSITLAYGYFVRVCRILQNTLGRFTHADVGNR